MEGEKGMDGIETNRLRIRPYRASDLSDFFAYGKSPYVGPAAGWKPHGSLEESKEILDRFIVSEEVFALEDRATGQVVGGVGLHPDERRPGVEAFMVGYVLAKANWGQGLMTEAVEALLSYAFIQRKAAVVSVYHYPENARSRRVIEKAGFQFEGILRRANRIFDGTYRDAICYSILSEEFELRSKESEEA